MLRDIMGCAYTENFLQAWCNLAERGQIKTVYPVREAIHSGTQVEIGIENSSGNAKYYAKESSPSHMRRLDGEILERFVEGTDFVVQFNPFRGYRPGTNKPEFRDGTENAPKPGAENCRFECQETKSDLSLLKRDPLKQVLLKNNGRYNLYYNAFPIEETGHFLYVPVERNGIKESLPHIAQVLTEISIEDTLELCDNSTDSILFFNSIHAGATADHFHIQMIPHLKTLKDGTPLRDGKYALERAARGEYGERKILEDYPIRGLFYSNEDKAKISQDILHLQKKGIPFNWILMGGNSYLLPRKKEFERVSEFSNILASVECLGKMVTSDRKIYDELTKESIHRAFGKMSYSVEELRGFGISSAASGDYDVCGNCVIRWCGGAGDPCSDCPHKS